MMRTHHEDENEVRRTLLRVVEQAPGIHFRGLERAARLSSVGQLRHHVDRLQRDGAIVEVEDGGYKRFFLAGQHNPKIRAGLARFARPVPRRIGKLLIKRPMTRTELRRQIGCADSTLGYHLTRMVLLGDVVKQRGRNCCLYRLADPEFVRTVFQTDAGSNAPAEGDQEAATPRPMVGNGTPPAAPQRPPGLFPTPTPAAAEPSRPDGYHAEAGSAADHHDRPHGVNDSE